MCAQHQHVLKRAMDFEIEGQLERGLLEEEECKKVGLREE